MLDIPVFTTQNGVASLGLKQIPYTAKAYIRLQDTCEPEVFLRECCDFCRAAGAEQVYAAGHAILENYPLYTQIVKMCRPLEGLPQTDAALFPVTEQTIEQWRQIYNSRMSGVPAAAFMTAVDARRHLKAGDAYFVHKGNTLLGIGVAAGERIDAVISAVPGVGQEVLLALCNALSGDRVVLEAALENKPAMALYRRLDLVVTEAVHKWYRIWPNAI